MSFHRQTAALLATALLGVGMPAMAQGTMAAGHSQSTQVTRQTVPGHVSTNKVKVVHVKKHVTVPAKAEPAGTGTVHHTTTTTVHKSSATSGGQH